MAMQESLIDIPIIFRLTNKAKEIGDIVLVDTELRLTMPPLEKQPKKPIDGSCGSPLILKDRLK